MFFCTISANLINLLRRRTYLCNADVRGIDPSGSMMLTLVVFMYKATVSCHGTCDHRGLLNRICSRTSEKKTV